MTSPTHEKMTQRRVAELAGVSQATVSLVLNGKADAASRIPEETRNRVLEIIEKTTYVADPAARRLAGMGNKILGVFTYEPAFPNETADFYTPLLTGIEARSEELGCDLLLFTSAPVENGRRQIFHGNNRLGLADGCLLLGLEMDAAELSRLVDNNFPFVAVGRRDVPGVPYVGADYVSGTAELTRAALAAGHERFFYLHVDSAAESVADRQLGFRTELQKAGIESVQLRACTGDDYLADWKAITTADPTVLFIEAPRHALEIYELARQAGVRVPSDLSIVVLGEPSRPSAQAIDFTRLSPPRTELGAEAVTLLRRILSSDDAPSESESRILLDCVVESGTTLAPPRNEGKHL